MLLLAGMERIWSSFAPCHKATANMRPGTRLNFIDSACREHNAAINWNLPLALVNRYEFAQKLQNTTKQKLAEILRELRADPSHIAILVEDVRRMLRKKAKKTDMPPATKKYISLLLEYYAKK